VAAHTVQRSAALIEADENELVCEIMSQMKGFSKLGEDRDDTSIPVIALNNEKTHDQIQDVRRYPIRAHRSVVGNQPYDTYAPQTTFLQLGVVRAHGSVLEVSHLTQMTKEERLLAMTMSPMEPTIDDAMHKIDPKLCTTSQEDMMVWAYLRAWFEEVWSKGNDRSGEGADAASLGCHWRSASYPESNKCARSCHSYSSRKSVREILRVKHA